MKTSLSLHEETAFHTESRSQKLVKSLPNGMKFHKYRHLVNRRKNSQRIPLKTSQYSLARNKTFNYVMSLEIVSLEM